MGKEFNIVYTGSFHFPEGMAGTKRVKNLFLSTNAKSSVLLMNNSSRNPKSGICDGIKYYTIFKYKSRVLKILLSPYLLLLGCTRLLSLFNKNYTINVLYVYSGINIENILLVCIAKLKGFKIIVDIVEDFSLNKENVSTWRAIKLRSNIYFEKKITVFVDGIIVISEYLNKKFNQEAYIKLPVILLPISASNIELKENKRPDIYQAGYSHLLYSGTYGIKDGFYYILNAIEKYVKANEKVKLVLTGTIPLKVLKEICSRKLNKHILTTGFLQEEEYYRILPHNDALLMTRINSKYANAGFPFKLGEYLASGTPVVATKVSDIELYLTNNDSAYLIKPESSEDILIAIKTILEDKVKAKKVGINGHLIAKRCFNPIIHRTQLAEFVQLTFK